MTCRSNHDIFTTTDDIVWERGGWMISSDIIRGYNDTMILFILLKEPSYGYEISKQIKEITEEKYIMKETTLYSAFKRLESNGYVESFKSDESYGKPRTYYRITDEGIKHYQSKCDEWEVTKEVVNKFIDKELNNGHN